MIETEKPKLNEIFIQGDIVRLCDRNESPIDPNYGVILNADCDLAHGKFDNFIALLPIYSIKKYFDKFLLPNYLIQIKENYYGELSSILSLSDSEISDLRDWLKSEDQESICNSICKQNEISKSDANRLRKFIEKLAILENDDQDSVKIFRNLSNLENNPERFIEKRILETFRNIGDGHYQISEITGERDVGFVVRMRRIFTIQFEHCFYSTSDFVSSDCTGDVNAIRIARLKEPFRFRLAQVFASHFTRIGLPEEVYEMQNFAKTFFAEQFYGDTP